MDGWMDGWMIYFAYQTATESPTTEISRCRERQRIMGSRGRKKQSWSHQPLTPLMEGPDVEMQQQERSKKESSWDAIREWFRPSPVCVSAATRRQDLRLVLGVLACPLAPIPIPLHHNLPPPLPLITRHAPLETCTAHYIIQQYLAATSNKHKTSNAVKNMYAAGSVKMTCCQTEVSGRSDYQRVKTSSNEDKGCFVVWQMSPGMWSLELVVGANKVLAGSDSKIVWRHTPWLGTHAAKGPQRPLRRIIQGLDPKSTATLFAGKAAQCLGEKRIGEEDCFVIKVAADRESVMERNEGPAAEVIRHVLYGYFSQRSGLLIYLEDSHLTRVLVHQPPPPSGTCMDDEDEVTAVYWETTIGSSIGDYRDVDGVLIAHQGRTVATVFRFGETSSQHCRTTMEELWSIDEVVFNVPGLSADCFIPPADIWDRDTP